MNSTDAAMPPALASPETLSSFLVDEWDGPPGSAVEPDAYLIAVAHDGGPAQARLRELLEAVLTARWVDELWGHRASRGWSRLFRVLSTTPTAMAPLGATLAKRFDSAQSRLLPLARGPAADPWLEFLYACSVAQVDGTLLSGWLSICDLPAGAGMRHGTAAVQGVVNIPDPNVEEVRDDTPAGEDEAEALLRFVSALGDRVDGRAVRAATASEYFAVASRAVLRKVSPEVVASKVASSDREFTSVTLRWMRGAGIPVGHDARGSSPPRQDFADEANALLDLAGPQGNGALQTELADLLNRERLHAERSGDIMPLCLSLRRFALHYETSDPERSIALAREATQWAPFDSYSWTALVRAYRAAKQGAAALDVGYRAIRRFPGVPVIWTEAALVLRTLNRFSDATYLLRVAHDRFPKNERLCDLLAYTLRARSQYGEAELYYRRALELSGNRNPHSWDGLIVVLSLQNRVSEAREAASEACREFPQDPHPRMRLGQLSDNNLDELHPVDASSDLMALSAAAVLQKHRIMRQASAISSDVDKGLFARSNEDLSDLAAEHPEHRARSALELTLNLLRIGETTDAEEALYSALRAYPQEVTLLHADAVLRRTKARTEGTPFSPALYASMTAPLDRLEESNPVLGALGDWNRLLALSVTPDGEEWSLARDKQLERFSRRLLATATAPSISDSEFVRLWTQRVQEDGRVVLAGKLEAPSQQFALDGLGVLDQEYALLGSSV